MRKTFIAVSIVLLGGISARAQETKQTKDVKDSVALDEVVVKASRVVSRVDGQTIFPSAMQKKSSASGYSLLRKLALPGIRVDEMSRTIESIANRGAVQVRVNGIVATSKDLQAMDVANITSVDFIDNPGVRYGSDIAYVINMLYFDSYTRVDIIADHLELSLDGSMARFFNRGDDYNHCYTSYGIASGVTGYLGNWTLQLSADSGWRFMEAYMKGLNAGMVNLNVGYRIGNCDITVYWVNPFQRNPLRTRSIIVNRYVGKTTCLYSKDAGNAVQLSVAWRLNRGKKYRDVKRKLNNKDKVTGIM